jgi:hypothetical protein
MTVQAFVIFGFQILEYIRNRKWTPRYQQELPNLPYRLYANSPPSIISCGKWFLLRISTRILSPKFKKKKTTVSLSCPFKTKADAAYQ